MLYAGWAVVSIVGAGEAGWAWVGVGTWVGGLVDSVHGGRVFVFGTMPVLSSEHRSVPEYIWGLSSKSGLSCTVCGGVPFGLRIITERSKYPSSSTNVLFLDFGVKVVRDPISVGAAGVVDRSRMFKISKCGGVPSYPEARFRTGGS